MRGVGSLKIVHVPVTSDTAAVLSGLNAGLGRRVDPDLPLPSLSFERQVAVGNRHGLLPWILADRGGRGEEQSLIMAESYQNIAEAVLSFQSREWRSACSWLLENNVRNAVFKGLLYSQDLFNAGERSIANDIDILIRTEDRNIVKNLLHQVGFSQNIVSHEGSVQLISDDIVLQFEETHYELFPFTKLARLQDGALDLHSIRNLGITHPFVYDEENILVAIELDVHHALSNGIDSGDIWVDTVTSLVQGLEVEHLGWETQVWFIAARLYHEVMVLDSKKLRPLIELGRIIKQKQISWSRVLDVSEKYSLGPGIFYVLSFLNDSLDVPVPPTVLHRMERQCYDNGRLHDFGDFTMKGLGESVLLRPTRKAAYCCETPE